MLVMKLTTAGLKVRQPEIKKLGTRRKETGYKVENAAQVSKTSLFMLPGELDNTYLSRPRRNALNLCLLCLSCGSSLTRT